MLLENHLGEELAKALDVDEVDYVHFACHQLRCLLMAFKPLHPALEPVLLLATTMAEALEQLRPAVLHVAVEVLSSAGHSTHHL